MTRLMIAVLVVALSGCNGTGVKSRLRSLDDSINAYAQALRWGRYDDAQQFHMTRDGERIALDEHVMADIRVTGYAVRETTFDDEGTSAQVQAEFKYFITSRGTLQTKVVPQTWWYDEDARRWFLDSGLPDFTPARATARETGDVERREPSVREVPREQDPVPH